MLWYKYQLLTPHHPVMLEDLPTLNIPPPITMPIAPLPTPGFYALFLLPSRFRKLEGLSFISANWMEYSWPFQWNQLTPCKEKDEVWEIIHPLLLLLSAFTALVSDCRLFCSRNRSTTNWKGVGKHRALATSMHNLDKQTMCCPSEL